MKFISLLVIVLLAVTCIPGPSDPKSARLFQVNPGKDIGNTVLVYQGRKVLDKFVKPGC